jgi:pyruvate kinase
MRKRLGTVGDVEECRERLAAEAEAGADIHRINIATDDVKEYEQIVARLL